MKTDALVLPHEPGWNEARLAWNLAVDQQPAAVALPNHPRMSPPSCGGPGAGA